MYKQVLCCRIIKYFFVSLFVVVSLNSMANTDKIENICEDIISQMVRIPDSNEHTGLWFGKYEVTQKQWETIMGYNPSRNSIGGSFPVDSVSLLECFEFIRRLNNRCSNKFLFRLPTEKEWIYAALAGSNRDFGLGLNGKKSKIDNICWYRKNSGFCTHNVGEKTTQLLGVI
jgi:formylglycine-generating enzyme required for sulfatase activity